MKDLMKLMAQAGQIQARMQKMQEELAGFRRSQAALQSPTGTPTGRNGESVEHRAERATGAPGRAGQSC